jgi:hypothetical protein
MNFSLKTDDAFPLPASLFFMDGNTPGSTWNLLARDKKGQVNTLVDKQTEYGSKLMTFMCFNMVDPSENVVNPFVGSPTVAELKKRFYSMGDVGWDQDEVNRWIGIISVGAKPGVYLIPTIYCGDDKVTTRDQEFVDWYTPIVIRAMYPYSAGFNLISEASKSWSTSEIDYVGLVAKKAFNIEPKVTPKPIFVHQQGVNVGSNADGLMYEFKKNPWKANEYSVSDVINELKSVLNSYPNIIWPQELAVTCEESWARNMSRAIRELAKTEPRIIGLPGPT